MPVALEQDVENFVLELPTQLFHGSHFCLTDMCGLARKVNVIARYLDLGAEPLLH